MASKNDLGDGDQCPLNPEHGNMLTIQGTQKQRCNHQSHDGRPKSHPQGAAPATRSMWPLGTNALEAAVRQHHDRP